MKVDTKVSRGRKGLMGSEKEEEEEGAEASGVDVVKYIIHWDETAVMLSASMYNEEI